MKNALLPLLLFAGAIHAELTPLFHALAAKVVSGEWGDAPLNPETCAGLAPEKILRSCRQTP